MRHPEGPAHSPAGRGIWRELLRGSFAESVIHASSLRRLKNADVRDDVLFWNAPLVQRSDSMMIRFAEVRVFTGGVSFAPPGRDSQDTRKRRARSSVLGGLL